MTRPDSSTWRQGFTLLEQRLASIPDALHATWREAATPLGIAIQPDARIVTTGIGSSEAHARLLAFLLGPERAHHATLTEVAAETDPGAVLVVFSQGLSPNAHLALETVGRWAAVVLVTAVRDAARLAPLRDRGVVIRFMAGTDEFGTLVRVVGPRCGYLAATLLARELIPDGPARARLPTDDVVARAIEGSTRAAAPGPDVAAFAQPTAFVTIGSRRRLVCNLQYKVLEGFLQPLPPVWDVLHVAHGPFQQVADTRATFVFVGHAGDAQEDHLFRRLEAMLDPARHTVLRLVAPNVGPLEILWHEAQLDAWMLRWIERHAIDQAAFPGQGRDTPLYDVRGGTPPRQLATTSSAALEGHLPTTAVIPLGACEQHGPHLPLLTDTWIADALAERFCARVPEAIAVPALPLGVSPEHVGFAGTLDIGADTLVSVLGDVLDALARQGFTQAFVFSAHGGNVATLRDALAPLRARVPTLAVFAHIDLDGLTRTLHDAAVAAGVSPEAAGHHAGEIETSMMLALRPTVVHLEAAAPGLLVPTADAQRIFYPRLSPHAPNGVVGDPRGACAARGSRYLDTWVDVLVATYEGAKNRHQANGTHQA